MLLSACSVSDVDSRVSDIVNPTVQVVIGDGDDYGSGVVLYVEKEGDEWVSYILTAYHVIDSAVFEKKPIAVRWWVKGIIVETHATVHFGSFKKDLAVLRVDRPAPGVAWVWNRDVLPWTFTDAYIGGIGALQIPIPTKGEVSAYIDGGILTSAHANPGYSGSALYAWSNGHWRVIGLIRGVGYQNGDLLYHLVFAIDWTTVSKWFEENNFDKLQK